jgi:NTE family protein
MKIGLVLSGGGARGIVHLGIVKALYEQNIQPDCISGTSAGAIAGALLANGYTPDEILDIILKTNFLKHFRPAFGGMGVLNINKVEKLFLQHLPHNSFENLKIPLTVATTDIQAGESVYFDTGELVRPLMASSCLPGIFGPVLHKKKYLVDGAILNNMPIEPLIDKADFLIGVNCNPYSLDKPIKSTRNVLERCIILAVRKKTQERLQSCDVVFEPVEVGKYDIFDVKKAREIFRIGYSRKKSKRRIRNKTFGTKFDVEL